MNFTTLKQITKDETKPVEAKNHMQTSAKFCEVCAFKISFLCPQNCSALQVLLSFATPPVFHYFAYLRLRA